MIERVLLTGATGFVGGHLHPALVRAGFDVLCASRRAAEMTAREPSKKWVHFDVEREDTLAAALEGIDAVVYLIHAMGEAGDFEAREQASAARFLCAADRAGVERIVYLGGVAPAGEPSRHLQSRLRTGELLRGGAVPTIELRAGMIIGAGSESWSIVRDLAARLPFMVLPRWLQNLSQPVAIDNVVAALVRALELEGEVRGVFDLPGPETLSGEEILKRVSRLLGVRPYTLRVPVLTPRLSSYWLKLVTSADFGIARQLVEGLTSNLIASNEGFWGYMPDRTPMAFDAAARMALDAEAAGLPMKTRAVEWMLQHMGRAG